MIFYKMSVLFITILSSFWNKWNSFISILICLELIMIFIFFLMMTLYFKSNIIFFLFMGVMEAVFGLCLLIFSVRKFSKNFISLF